MSKFKFIKTALKDRKVGALTPSSKYVVRKVIGEIKPEYKIIVEYGAGDGVITKEILKILPPDGKLLAIETNDEFIEKLKNIRDKRLIIIKEDARNISKRFPEFGFAGIDMVISGIPFSFIKPRERKEIIKNAYDNLADSGKLLLYQNFPLVIFNIKNFLWDRVNYRFEPRNFLPYFIITAVK